MLRKLIAQKYIDASIEYIIGHNPSVYLRNFFLMCISLLVLYVARSGSYTLRDGHKYISLIAAVLGLYCMIRYLIDFFNHYLDAIALTPHGVYIFRWEGILEYKTELFERHKIELISFEQHSLLDRIFMKGDILISLDFNTSFTFENISHPQKRVNAIVMAKHRYAQPPEPDFQEEQQEKFDILVETLGEVIQEYMHKEKRTG